MPRQDVRVARGSIGVRDQRVEPDDVRGQVGIGAAIGAGVERQRAGQEVDAQVQAGALLEAARRPTGRRRGRRATDRCPRGRAPARAARARGPARRRSPPRRAPADPARPRGTSRRTGHRHPPRRAPAATRPRETASRSSSRGRGATRWAFMPRSVESRRAAHRAVVGDEAVLARRRATRRPGQAVVSGARRDTTPAHHCAHGDQRPPGRLRSAPGRSHHGPRGGPQHVPAGPPGAARPRAVHRAAPRGSRLRRPVRSRSRTGSAGDRRDVRALGRPATKRQDPDLPPRPPFGARRHRSCRRHLARGPSGRPRRCRRPERASSSTCDRGPARRWGCRPAPPIEPSPSGSARVRAATGSAT